MPFIKGYKQTDEQKRKMVETRMKNGSYIGINKGRHHTEEAKEKNRLAHLGNTPWNKGKNGVMPTPWNKGSKNGSLYSDEQLKRFSDSHKGRTGEKASRWQGGITPSNTLVRNGIKFRLWREAVFARDNWTCQKCLTRGGMLHAHHIKSFAKFKELRFAIDNGITLCRECHKKFHRTYGNTNIDLDKINEYLERFYEN